MTAFEAGRFAETDVILRPLADAGNAKAQACVGSLLMVGLHRFADIAAYDQWCSSVSPDQVADYAKPSEKDVRVAATLLRAASDAGEGGASHNLAMLYVNGYGGEDWKVRKRKALALLAKARFQGFHCFNDGEPPGTEYLTFLEQACPSVRRSP